MDYENLCTLVQKIDSDIRFVGIINSKGRLVAGGMVSSKKPLEDTKKEGQNSPNGIFGWGGYHTTHFWIDPKNKLYAVFMARLYPYNGKTQTEFRQAVYEALK